MFEASEEAEIADICIEPAQLQDCPKDQGEELVQFNIAEEGKEAQPVFISASLSGKLKQELSSFERVKISMEIR